MNVDDRLAALGLTLPTAPSPVGNYQRAIVHGGVGYLSGQLPLRDGRPLFTGRVGDTLTEEEGRKAAELTALNVLAQLKLFLGSWDPLVTLLRVDGFVVSAPGFSRLAPVLDGASDLFVAVLRERGAHVRSAVGVQQLPLDAPVELVVNFAVR